MRRSVRLLCTVLLSCRNEPNANAPPALSVNPATTGASTSAGGSESPAPIGPGAAPEEPSDNSVAVYDPLPLCTGYYERTLKVYSWTQPQLRARFGPPTTKEAYRVVERQGEFYSLVEEIYPTTDPKNLDVPIEEWTWEKKDCRLTVWFHRPDGTWRALGDLLWHYGDEF
jgi:hypothetical protein